MMQVASSKATSGGVVSPIHFLVSNSARECGVVNPVVCLIHNVRSTKEAGMYDAPISDLMRRIGDIRAHVLPSKEVQGFRELYARINSSVTPAGERFLQSLTAKPFPRYGNLIDAYNIVALETVSPFGMHDAKELLDSKGPLVFKRALGNEEIHPAFKKEKATIPQGDFTYGIERDGKFVPFAWLGKEDVDSKAHQVSKKTQALLFTAIGNQYTSIERNVELCQRVFAMIKLSCPDAKMDILTPQFIN